MEIEIEIDDVDVKYMEYFTDVKKWINDIIAEKVSNCQDRIISQNIDKLRDDDKVETIPANKEDLVKIITARKDYKKREKDELYSAPKENRVRGKVK